MLRNLFSKHIFDPHLTAYIAVCEELTEEIKSNAQSTWAKRMQSVESAWEGSRATIFKALLECHAIPSSDALCFICGCKTAVIRCHQCGPRVLMCSSCDAELRARKETSP